MSNAKVRGCKTLLKFGTTAIPGFIVEETGFDEEAENVEIADEALDIVVDVSGVEAKNSGRLKVIPLSDAIEPRTGQVLEYENGNKTRRIIVDSLRSTNVKKDAVRWDIEGHAHPCIDLSGETVADLSDGSGDGQSPYPDGGGNVGEEGNPPDAPESSGGSGS